MYTHTHKYTHKQKGVEGGGDGVREGGVSMKTNTLQIGLRETETEDCALGKIKRESAENTERTRDRVGEIETEKGGERERKICRE